MSEVYRFYVELSLLLKYQIFTNKIKHFYDISTDLFAMQTAVAIHKKNIMSCFEFSKNFFKPLFFLY